ncbi:MAG: TlpA disulfide reductase family protein [Candidatus Latescibacterota bacterium]|jgi:peroxiredoxin
MSALRPCVIGLLAIIASGLLGASVLLASRIINPPPVDLLDLEYLAYLGDPAPPYELPGLDGQTITSTDLAGRAHVLFWGDPDCEACKEVYPQLKQTAEKVPILMIAISSSRAAIAQSRTEQGFTFPVAFDSLRATLVPYHVIAYPTAMLIDSKGRIRKAASGNIMAARVLAYAGRKHR